MLWEEKKVFNRGLEAAEEGIINHGDKKL